MAGTKSIMQYRALIAGVIIALLSGCTTIDYNNRIEGWPDMETTITKVTPEEASQRCRESQSHPCSTVGGFLVTITSCYQWDFDAGRDWIWYGVDEDLEHERGHHLGHPHVGDTPDIGMQCYLDEWRKKKKEEAEKKK